MIFQIREKNNEAFVKAKPKSSLVCMRVTGWKCPHMGIAFVVSTAATVVQIEANERAQLTSKEKKKNEPRFVFLHFILDHYGK